MHRLREMENRAFHLKDSGKFAEAAEIFSKILQEQPDWEHGNGLFYLAQCYEDLGLLKSAEKFYRASTEYEPTNDIFLGGLASFLYLHGKPEEAFDAYLRLLTLTSTGDADVDAPLREALSFLGRKN